MDESEGKGEDKSTSHNGPVKDPIMVGAFFTVIAIFLTFMYFYIRNKKKGRSILIVGPPDTGKTALFLRLGFNKDGDTVTSTGPNVTEIDILGKAPLILKNLPGSEKVRMKFWIETRIGMRGIICVIDSAGGNKSIREAAEVLYEVLTDPIVNSVCPSILIFANKQDLPTAKGTKVLRIQLERELTTLRLTKSASLKTISGASGSGNKILGKSDRDFDFDHLNSLKIEFAEGTSYGDEADITAVTKWLNSVA